METVYFLGLDLGQRHDYTALAVAERRTFERRWDPVNMGYREGIRLEFIHSHRFPLGTSYVAIAQQIRQLIQKLEAEKKGVRLAVDATGVGGGVVDVLKAMGLRSIIWPVTVTGGSSGGRAVVARGQEYFTVSKTDLFYTLLVAMEQRRTVFSRKMANLKALQDEFSCLGAVLTERGARVTGATGADHDDLAFSVALAQWAALKVYPGDVKRAMK